MKRLLIGLLLLFTLNVFSQTQNEIKIFRKVLVGTMDNFSKDYEPLIKFDTWFSDYEDALIVKITVSSPIDLTAKEMCNTIYNEWRYQDRYDIHKYGDVSYFKVIYVNSDGTKTSYKRKLLNYEY